MSDVSTIDTLVVKFEDLKTEIGKVIIGQEQAVLNVLLSVICGGHSLLIGVPGLAKTLLVKVISDTLGLGFKRIQFTPDLMPSDILGSEILDNTRQFRFIKGPIFSNIVLADEINRTPPKTQAALLEAMQEHSVTISGQHHQLEPPFLVLATQNPIEQEGTYPLPEAQLDRFMFSINLEYPNFQEEIKVVKNTTSNTSSETRPILSLKNILEIQKIIRKIPVTDNVVEYAVSLVRKTRPKNPEATDFIRKYVDWGAGPRASQNLVLAAKANAAIRGKYSPDIEDVIAVSNPILSHRVVRNYKAEAENISVSDLIKTLL